VWNWRQGRDTALPEARAGERRIDATEHWAADPPDPWERDLDRRLLPSLQGEGMRGHPYRPVTLRDVPPAAAEDLGDGVGSVVAERIFVLPSGRRTTDRGGNQWVTTPTRVIAIGDDAIALWVDDGVRPGVRARIPFAEVLAVMDLNVLLLGRLEIAGERDSFVVRYNAVNRPDLRDMLLPMRRSYAAMRGPRSASSLQPSDLPFKWKGAVLSSDVQVAGPEDVVIAAGGLGGRRGRAHGGVAVLTSRELVIATDPTSSSKEAEYGFDTVAVPRSRVQALAGTNGLLEIRIASNAPTTLWLTVDPELASQIRAVLGSGVTP
jgi:hypothetical protein